MRLKVLVGAAVAAATLLAATSSAMAATATATGDASITAVETDSVMSCTTVGASGQGTFGLFDTNVSLGFSGCSTYLWGWLPIGSATIAVDADSVEIDGSVISINDIAGTATVNLTDCVLEVEGSVQGDYDGDSSGGTASFSDDDGSLQIVSQSSSGCSGENVGDAVFEGEFTVVIS